MGTAGLSGLQFLGLSFFHPVAYPDYPGYLVKKLMPKLLSLKPLHLAIEILCAFWKQHPAALYALSLFLGFRMALAWDWTLSIPCFLIWGPLLFPSSRGFRSHLLLTVTLPLIAICYTPTHFHFPELPKEGTSGTGHIEINSVSSTSSHFGQGWLYKCTLHNFVSNEGKESIAHGIPCTLSIPKECKRPLANQDYIVKGTLKELAPHRYALKVSLQNPWAPVPGTWSLAEYRWLAKKKVSSYIHRHTPSFSSANFLIAIATGEFDDQQMLFDFGRLGLQHILAISGFHFSIVALFLSFLLRCFLPEKQTAMVVILLLSSYYLFLGWGPSIQRAWITIMIYFCGKLLEKTALPLNCLAIAMILVMLSSPLSCESIGFQFSFLATAAILFFYSEADTLLQKLLKKRPLDLMADMSGVSQHGYVLLSCFRQAVAITLAVHIAVVPLTLYQFHKFPWLSLLYNLFFPFLVSLSMGLLLLAAGLTALLPPLGRLLHLANSSYTDFILSYPQNAPASLDSSWRVTSLSLPFITGYLSILLLGGIIIKHIADKKREREQDLFF